MDLPRPSVSPPTKRRPSRVLYTSTDRVLSSLVAALPPRRQPARAGRKSAVWNSITDFGSTLSRSLSTRRKIEEGIAGRQTKTSMDSCSAKSSFTKSLSSLSRSSEASSPDFFRESARDARLARWDPSAWKREDRPQDSPPPRKPRSQSVPNSRGGVEKVNPANALYTHSAAHFNRVVSPATYRLCRKQLSPSALRPRISPSLLRSFRRNASPSLASKWALRPRVSPPALRRFQKQLSADSPSALRPRSPPSPLRPHGQPGSAASPRHAEREVVEELGRDDVPTPDDGGWL